MAVDSTGNNGLLYGIGAGGLTAAGLYATKVFHKPQDMEYYKTHTDELKTQLANNDAVDQFIAEVKNPTAVSSTEKSSSSFKGLTPEQLDERVEKELDKIFSDGGESVSRYTILGDDNVSAYKKGPLADARKAYDKKFAELKLHQDLKASADSTFKDLQSIHKNLLVYEESLDKPSSSSLLSEIRDLTGNKGFKPEDIVKGLEIDGADAKDATDELKNKQKKLTEAVNKYLDKKQEVKDLDDAIKSLTGKIEKARNANEPIGALEGKLRDAYDKKSRLMREISPNPGLQEEAANISKLHAKASKEYSELEEKARKAMEERDGLRGAGNESALERAEADLKKAEDLRDAAKKRADMFKDIAEEMNKADDGKKITALVDKIGETHMTTAKNAQSEAGKMIIQTQQQAHDLGIEKAVHEAKASLAEQLGDRVEAGKDTVKKMLSEKIKASSNTISETVSKSAEGSGKLAGLFEKFSKELPKIKPEMLKIGGIAAGVGLVIALLSGGNKQQQA